MSQCLHLRTKRTKLAPNNRRIPEERQETNVALNLSVRSQPQPQQKQDECILSGFHLVLYAVCRRGCGSSLGLKTFFCSNQNSQTKFSCLASRMHLLLGANSIRFVLKWRYWLNFECGSSLLSIIIQDFGSLTVTNQQTLLVKFHENSLVITLVSNMWNFIWL